jgi:MFS family permease
MASHALGLIELEDRKKRSSTSLTRGEEDHVPSKNNGVDLMLGPSRSNARFPSQNSPADGEQNQIDSPAADSVSRTTLVIVTLSGVNFLNTLGSGILTVGLPRMAVDLALNPSILFWPASVYALAAGCTLLLFGSLADVIGDKRIWLTGSIMYTVFTLACGLAQTAIQLIVFRTFLGLSIAMCLPSGVSLMTRTCPPGSRRNVGFACMGVGQPLGYAVGLVVGGVFVDTIGWRYGYYISAVVNGILSAAAFCALPGIPSALSAVGPETGASRRETWYKTLANIDWIGVLFISASLGLLSYVLA